jgi:glutathione S-transferase
MLELCGTPWEAIFVDYYNGAHRTAEFRRINEMAEVPVLEHGSLRLTQSGVILFYLVDQFDCFGSKNADQHREILRWLLWDNHKLSSYIGTWRFLTSFANENERNPGAADLFGNRARHSLGILDRHLEGRNWIIGDEMTIADLSCVGYMFYADEVPVDWEAEFPNLVAWRERIRGVAGWKHPYELMPGHPIPTR